jgi:uncharacterized protein YlxW (UPF0749 family)
VVTDEAGNGSDTEAIAALRNAAPSLISEVRELRGVVASRAEAARLRGQAAHEAQEEVRRLRARVKELEERHDAYRDSILAEIARNG